MIEGSAGYTTTYVMASTSGTNFVIRLGDAAGANKLAIQNSSSVEKASIDSSGALTVTSFNASTGTLILPQSATPSQTAEGSVFWDTDDDLLTIGTGAGTKIIGLSRGAGLSATSLKELAYDTTAAQLNVWNGSTSVPSAASFFDSERAAFRANRRLVAYYTAQANTTAGTPCAVGVGWYQFPVDSSDIPVGIGTEPVFKVSTATAGSGGISLINDVAATIVSPSHNPRMLMRVVLPASSANVTRWLTGFISNATSSTPNGAYLKILTTGNVFFVTRQGGSETTTDLGALSRTSTVLGFEIETADAGVTWVCRNQAGVALATHTTNVPTAATGVTASVYGTTATGAIPWGIAMAIVEGTFA